MKTILQFSAAVLLVMVAATSMSFGYQPQVPEIDPSMGAGALALISGGIMVIRGRRRR